MPILRTIAELLNRLDRRQEGQGLVEYSLVIALIAVVAISGLVFLGSNVSGNLSTVGSAMNGATQPTPSLDLTLKCGYSSVVHTYVCSPEFTWQNGTY